MKIHGNFGHGKATMPKSTPTISTALANKIWPFLESRAYRFIESSTNAINSEFQHFGMHFTHTKDTRKRTKCSRTSRILTTHANGPSAPAQGAAIAKSAAILIPKWRQSMCVKWHVNAVHQRPFLQCHTRTFFYWQDFTVSNTAIGFSRQICDQDTRLLGIGVGLKLVSRRKHEAMANKCAPIPNAHSVNLIHDGEDFFAFGKLTNHVKPIHVGEMTYQCRPSTSLSIESRHKARANKYALIPKAHSLKLEHDRDDFRGFGKLMNEISSRKIVKWKHTREVC